MLKSYEVANFKSFKNKTKFDLEKTNYQTLASTNLKGNILKGLMFVGANASGKSNAIMAVKFLLDSLFGKLDINIDAYMCMFSGEPVMSLAYTFDVENTEILYEIKYQRVDKKLNEDLFVDGKNILSRDGSVAIVNFYEETVYTDAPKDMLFLRYIFFNTKFRGWESLQKWFSFLSNSIYLDLYSGNAILYRDIDLSLKSYLDQDGAEEINQFFDDYNFEQKIEYDSKSEGQVISVESTDKMVFFKRKGINEPIPFILESLGNRTLLQLLPLFFHCIKQGGLLLLDEFSSGFHNDLEELLIRYFMKKADEAQLIFVSHSTNLLSNSILRPDQIYSINFGNEGSIIKRFSSEKPREDRTWKKCIWAVYLMEYQNMNIRLNKEKSIGKVLYIVEGGKTEPFLLRRIFCNILDYQLETILRNKKYQKYNSKENATSQVFVINAEESNIKNIEKDNEFLDKLFTELIENYDFSVDNAAIYYIFDRDNQSNTDVKFIKTMLTILGNARDNEYERQGLLLLSYPSIESFTLSNFIDGSFENLYETGNNLKQYLHECKINQSKITEDTLKHAVRELYDALSLLCISLIDLGVLEIVP